MTQLMQISKGVLRALWPQLNPSLRCAEIMPTVPCRGQPMDRAHAVPIACLSMLRRQVSRGVSVLRLLMEEG